MHACQLSRTHTHTHTHTHTQLAEQASVSAESAVAVCACGKASEFVEEIVQDKEACTIRRHLGSNTQEAHHSLRVPHRAQRALCAHLRQKHKVTERSASWGFEASRQLR
jgi:hypothetical protein